MWYTYGERSGGTEPMKKTPNVPASQRLRLPLLIAAALVLLAIFISLFRDMGVIGLWKLRKTERQLRSEVEQLRRENADLKTQVEGLRSNPAMIEDEARRLGLMKDKEKVIVVPRVRNRGNRPHEIRRAASLVVRSRAGQGSSPHRISWRCCSSRSAERKGGRFFSHPRPAPSPSGSHSRISSSHARGETASFPGARSCSGGAP